MTAPLRPDSGLQGRGDEIYAALVDAQTGLSEAAGLALTARLALLLANELGDPDRVLAAIAAARASLATNEPPQGRDMTASGAPPD